MKLNSFGKVRNLILLMGLCLTLAVTTACTREAKEEGTKISMSFGTAFSKAQSLNGTTIPAGFYPGHVIANVQFDGNTALYHWDCKEMEDENGDPSLCTFPTYIDFNGRFFPRGSGRVVQVLLVYANEQEQMIFAYDDAIGVDFNSDLVEVSIGGNWSIEGGGKMANVAGRHDSFKSGKVEAYYQPSRADRPRMKFFDEHIFAGWFRFMFFEGVKLSYYHIPVFSDTETPLFIEKSLEDFQTRLTSDRAAVAINVPQFYKVFQEGDNTYRSDFGGGEDVILGFFNTLGNPKLNGSRSIKMPTAAAIVPEGYRRILGGSLLDPLDNTGAFVDPSDGSSGGTEGMWSSYQLSFAMGIDANASTSNFYMQSHGMLTSNTTACSAVSDTNLVTNTCIKVKPEHIKDHKLVPFEGPFEAITDNYGAQVLSNDSQSAISWKFLPGVAGNAVHGVALFIVDQDRDFHDHAPCHEMALNENVSGTASRPFIASDLPQVFHVKTIAVGTANQGGSHDFGAVNLSNKKALACTWVEANGQKYFSSFAADNHGFHGNSSNTSQPPATQLSIKNVGPSEFSYLNRNACIPMEVEALDDNGNPGSLPGGNEYQVDLSQGEGGFYKDPGCTQSITNPYVMRNGFELIFFKATNNIGDVNIQVVKNAAETETLTADSFNVPVTSEAAATALTVIGPPQAYTTQCQPYLFTVVDASGVPTPNPSAPMTVNYFTNPSNGTFYPMNSCGVGSITNDSIGTGYTNVMAEFHGSSATTINIEPTNTGGLNNINLNGITIIDPGDAEYAILEVPDHTNIGASACQMFEIVTYKSLPNGPSVRAHAPSNLTYSLLQTLGAAYFYPDYGTCISDSGPSGTGAISSFIQAGGTSSVEVWFKTGVSNTAFSITVDETGGNQFDTSRNDLSMGNP